MKKKLFSLLLVLSIIPMVALPTPAGAEQVTVTTTHRDMDFDELSDAECSGKPTVDGRLYLKTDNSTSDTFSIGFG